MAKDGNPERLDFDDAKYGLEAIELIAPTESSKAYAVLIVKSDADARVVRKGLDLLQLVVEGSEATAADFTANASGGSFTASPSPERVVSILGLEGIIDAEAATTSQHKIEAWRRSFPKGTPAQPKHKASKPAGYIH